MKTQDLYSIFNFQKEYSRKDWLNLPSVTWQLSLRFITKTMEHLSVNHMKKIKTASSSEPDSTEVIPYHSLILSNSQLSHIGVMIYIKSQFTFTLGLHYESTTC